MTNFTRSSLLAVAALAASTLAACYGGAPTAATEADTLSRYDLLHVDRGRIALHADAVSYDVRNELFSDYAVKARAIRVPRGEAARYTATGAFEFPVGTVAAKSFGYPSRDGGTRWIETRLLVRKADGWHGYVYQWDDAQRTATRLREGAEVALDAPGVPSTHAIPSESECIACHGASGAMAPIGLRAVALNRPLAATDGADGPQEQLAAWSARGMLAGMPPLASVPRAARWDDPDSGTVGERARAYLDANCAHCHSSGGLARATGVFFGLDVTDPRAGGVCAPAGGAETPYVVAPGDPARSFLVHRVESTTPGEMMPPLGRAAVDQSGAALLEEWIREMPGDCGREDELR